MDTPPPLSTLKILVGMQLHHATPAALLLQTTPACVQMQRLSLVLMCKM